MISPTLDLVSNSVRLALCCDFDKDECHVALQSIYERKKLMPMLFWNLTGLLTLNTIVDNTNLIYNKTTKEPDKSRN
jgi:hypothetical protein